MIALIHDVLVTVGALMLANYEFDLTVIAALLTIVGFSVNDTVVICDRIRENLRKIKRESLESIINTSINETLSRTILTTGTALLVLMALYLLGGAVIRPFAFALAGGLRFRRLLDDLYRQSGHSDVGEVASDSRAKEEIA